MDFAGRQGKFGTTHRLQMTDTDSTPVAPRRSNFVLRALIDEMLEQVRELDRTSPTLTPEARTEAEAALDALMARVRRAALKRPVA